MIQFKLPSFRVRVSEKKNVAGMEVIDPEKRWRYCYAENAKQAIALITAQDRKIFVHVDTIQARDFSEEWEKDVKTAIANVKKAVKAGKNPDFPSKWSKLKEHLIDLFHGKCGYCEAKFIAVAFGDVEHYRPKGSVSEEPNHPGYYWLAYAPTNYLPACQLCNEPAKKDHFPIAGTRAHSDADPLESENPLLLNPYVDHYEEHLEFVPSKYTAPAGTAPQIPGDIKAKTPKGQYTISTMELDRDPIMQARLNEMTAATQSIELAFVSLGTTRNFKQFIESLQKQVSEDRPFRTAVYYELRDFLMQVRLWEEVKPLFSALGFKTE